MKASVVVAAVVVCLSIPGISFAGEAPPAASKDKEKNSVAIGLIIGADLKQRFGDDIDVESVAKGLREAFSDKQSMTPAEVQESFQQLQTVMQNRAQKAVEEAKQKGVDFLTANKTKEGVKTTASGLQYKVIKEGEGESPKATDTVLVNYKGTLVDGTEFDSSYKRGKPTSFQVGRVIPGWVEGLQLMKPGAKYEFYIPSDLAYGPNPPPQSGIPPNSVLIFEVELISVNGAEKK